MIETIEMTLVDEINREHELSLECLRSSYYHALRVGELLLQVKNKLLHGDFIKWINANCKFTERSAQNYMKLYKYRELVEQEKTKRVSFLELEAGVESISVNEALAIIHDHELQKVISKRIERAVARAKEQVAEQKKAKLENYDKQVKDYLDSASSLKSAIAEAIEALDGGKFAPEAKQFTYKRNSSLIRELEKFNVLLKASMEQDKRA